MQHDMDRPEAKPNPLPKLSTHFPSSRLTQVRQTQAPHTSVPISPSKSPTPQPTHQKYSEQRLLCVFVVEGDFVQGLILLRQSRTSEKTFPFCHVIRFYSGRFGVFVRFLHLLQRLMKPSTCTEIADSGQLSLHQNSSAELKICPQIQ